MKNYKQIVLLLGILFFCSIPGMYLSWYSSQESWWYAALNVLVAIPVASIIASMPHRVGRILLLSMIAIINLTSFTTLVEHASLFNASEMLAVVAANPYEVNGLGEYLAFSLRCHMIFLLCCYVLLVIAIICISEKEKWHWWLFAGSVVILLILQLLGVLDISRFEPYNMCKQTYYLMKHSHTRNTLASYADGMTYNAIREDSILGNETYVLAIGESLNYKHFSLNGTYLRTTTPNLEQMEDITLFTNYYANAVFTGKSVPLLLSRCTPDNFNDHYKEKGIAQVFREAGFRSILISHRAQLMNDGVHSYLTSGFDTLIWVEADSIIPQKLHEVLQDGGKNFVVLHYLGNHMMYENYTPKYEVFTPSYTTVHGVERDSLFLNAYDNSVLYADHIISSSIEQLKKTDGRCAFLFVSDHGEYIDDVTGGHGFSDNPDEMEYHVPFVIWTNAEFNARNTEKLENMKRHKDTPISGNNIFWSLLDLANITIDNQEMDMSVFGDTITYAPRKLVLPDMFHVKTID